MASPPMLLLPSMVVTNPTKRTGQCTLIFDWELVLNEQCGWRYPKKKRNPKKTSSKSAKQLALSSPQRTQQTLMRLPNRSPTRLRILSHQQYAHHPKESCFRTGVQTGARIA